MRYVVWRRDSTQQRKIMSKTDEEIYMAELSKSLFIEGKTTAAAWCKRAADKIAELNSKVEQLESKQEEKADEVFYNQYS